MEWQIGRNFQTKRAMAASVAGIVAATAWTSARAGDIYRVRFPNSAVSFAACSGSSTAFSITALNAASWRFRAIYRRVAKYWRAYADQLGRREYRGGLCCLPCLGGREITLSLVQYKTVQAFTQRTFLAPNVGERASCRGRYLHDPRGRKRTARMDNYFADLPPYMQAVCFRQFAREADLLAHKSASPAGEEYRQRAELWRSLAEQVDRKRLS